MRPLFAIAPLALMLAIAAPRPVRWDAAEQARQEAERAPWSRTASAPETLPASERRSVERPSVARTHVSTSTLSAEGPFPQGRPH